MDGKEAVMFMEGEKVYFESWAEEGWDEGKDAADSCSCYYKVIVRDHNGNMLSEEVGSFCQAADGTWWIA